MSEYQRNAHGGEHQGDDQVVSRDDWIVHQEGKHTSNKTVIVMPVPIAYMSFPI